MDLWRSAFWFLRNHQLACDKGVMTRENGPLMRGYGSAGGECLLSFTLGSRPPGFWKDVTTFTALTSYRWPVQRGHPEVLTVAVVSGAPHHGGPCSFQHGGHAAMATARSWRSRNCWVTCTSMSGSSLTGQP